MRFYMLDSGTLINLSMIVSVSFNSGTKNYSCTMAAGGVIMVSAADYAKIMSIAKSV